jgi:hypothetical protein
MRSPIADANAGAAMDVAPTKKHAVRTATIAQHNNNNAAITAQNINQASSTLGNALSSFMGEKRDTEMQQRYQKAYHEQGFKQGQTEFQKDSKNTGFTEIIYGGQTPEYLGSLHASAKNAADSMYVEEAAFIEGEGADMPPEQYQKYMSDKITNYNLENFKEAPDAAFAFMENWKDNSNELTKDHLKLYKVRELEKARRTVAEGFQTTLSKYKQMMNTNPDKAAEIGSKLFAGEYIPKGMSTFAARQTIVNEAFTAIRAHDYSAFKLLNESGLVSSFDAKERNQYETVRGIIDTDNFDMLEAERLRYEAAIETSTDPNVVAAARQQYASARTLVAARDTKTYKHLKTVAGADRYRGKLVNQYKKQLQDAVRTGVVEQKSNIVLDDKEFVYTMYKASPDKRRTILTDRQDDLVIKLEDPNLPDEVRSELIDQFERNQKQLEKWTSEEEARLKKENAAQAKADQEAKDLVEGVQSLITGGGFTKVETKAKKAHLKGAIDSVVNQINPDKDISTIDKLEGIFGSPVNVDQVLRGSAGFINYLPESEEVVTAVKNLAVNLRGKFTEDNTFTSEQVSNATALETLKDRAAPLFVAATTADERVQIAHMQNAIKMKMGVAESVRQLDKIVSATDVKVANRKSSEVLLQSLGVVSAESDVQNSVYTEYVKHLPLGEKVAFQAAQTFANGINTRVDNRTIRYGGSFESLGGRNLEDAVRILGKTYKTGSMYKTGFQRVLKEIVGGSVDAFGNEIRGIEQVPNAQLSIFQGGIRIELNGRVGMIQRPELEAELNGYDEWKRGSDSIRPRPFWD